MVDDGLLITRVDVDAEALHTTVSSSSTLVVLQIHRGSVVIRDGSHRRRLTDNSLVLLPLDTRTRLQFSRAEFDLLSFPPAVVARVFDVRSYALHLHTERLTPTTDQLGQYVRDVAALLTAAPSRVQAYQRDLIRTRTIDALTAAVIEAFALVNHAEDATDRDVAVVHRALAVMRRHLTVPISVPEIADAAGVSVRSLQLVLRRQLNTSPLQQLRAMRLEAARHALEDADAPESVTEIARRYGYANDGRFAAHYRHLFGESPIATAKQTHAGNRRGGSYR